MTILSTVWMAHRGHERTERAVRMGTRGCQARSVRGPALCALSWLEAARAGTACSRCCRLLRQVKQQQIMQGFMLQTRPGSSSVTSAIVTACSSVMLQTSCPPGASFPTCFPQLCPSRFGRGCWGSSWGCLRPPGAGLWLVGSCCHAGAAILPPGKGRSGSGLSLPNWDHCIWIHWHLQPHSRGICRTLPGFLCAFSSLIPPLASLGWQVFKTLWFNGYNVVTIIN